MSQISPADLILNKDKSVYHLCLRPKDIADTIITVGDPGRVHSVSKHFDSVDFEMNKREFITHTGKLNGKRITVMSTGMGTDNIEILMTELDALVNIDLKKRVPKQRKKKLTIIRIGTSGGLQEDIEVGSHLRSDTAIGLDTLMCFYNLKQSSVEEKICKEIQKKTGLPYTPYCVSASEKLKKKFANGFTAGNTVTAPGFYGPQGRKVRLQSKLPRLMDELNYFHYNDYWLTNFEMETAGYYAMAKLLDHETISLNAIIANRITKEVTKDSTRVVNSLINRVLEQF